MREISLDTETTGLDPYAGHRIVEIGAVEMIDHVSTGNHFHTYLNPQRDMPAEAEQVHGLSEDFLRDKPLFHQVSDAFIEFIQDSPLVIHNASFDIKFINYELEKIGYPTLPMSRSIDTVQMARKLFPGQPANLDALCKRFQIDTTARVKHGALLDAELLADVYLELKGGRQSKLNLKQEQAEAQKASLTETEIRQSIPLREFAVTKDEVQAHQQLIDQLGDAIWHRYTAS